MNRRRVFPLELGAVALIACGAGAGGSGSGAPIVVAVVEVTDAAAPPATLSGAAPSPGHADESRHACELETQAGPITPSSPTCTIYEQVSRGGRVVLPCGGADGPASATFGEHEYKGEVHARRLVLDHAYDFEEKDGCQWRVKGHIVGTIDEGGGGGKLSWSYREQILEDDTSNCWATCTAHTSIKLSPVQ